MTQFREGDRRGLRRLAVVERRERVAERLVSCPLLGGGEVNYDGCTQLSKGPANNLGGCTKEKCESPWRLCAACVVSGAENPRSSTDPLTGFCGPHLNDGARIVTEASPSFLPTLDATDPKTRQNGAVRQSGGGPMPVALSAPAETALSSPNGDGAEPLAGEVSPPPIEVKPTKAARHTSGKRVEDPFAELREIEEMQREFPQLSREEIGKRRGVSKGWVDQRIMLKGLSPKVEAMMDPTRPEGEHLTLTKALRLTKFPHPLQEALAEEILHMPHDAAAEHIRKRTSQVVKKRRPRKPQEAVK